MSIYDDISFAFVEEDFNPFSHVFPKAHEFKGIAQEVMTDAIKGFVKVNQ